MDSDPGIFFADLGEDSVVQSTGYALRPRKFDIALAIARLRGGKLLPVPLSKTEIDELIRKKEDRDMKSQALADLWSTRR
jgi:hypothetical protein